MKTLKITWLEEQSECEDCGTSFASGAVVSLEDEQIVRLIPYAHCYNSVTYTEYEIFKEILEKLGYVLEEDYE